MSNFKLMVLPSASPGLLARFRAELSNETPIEIPMASLPDRRSGCASAAALLWFAWTVALTPALRPVTTPAVLEDMLLRNGEVQYVCRHAARQPYGRSIAAAAAWFGPFGPFENVTADETI
jgi:hypothetical protein